MSKKSNRTQIKDLLVDEQGITRQQMKNVKGGAGTFWPVPACKICGSTTSHDKTKCKAPSKPNE